MNDFKVLMTPVRPKPALFLLRFPGRMPTKSKAKKAEARGALPAPSKRLTRAVTAERLGLTASGVRGRVRLGHLHEHHDGRGGVFYDVDEVEAIASSKASTLSPQLAAVDGGLSSRAFKLFASGIDLRRAVVELCQPLAVAETLARDYAAAGGEVLFLLRPATLERLRAACAWRGSTEESLALAVEKQLGEIVDQRDMRADAAARDAEAARREVVEVRAKLVEVEATNARLRESLTGERALWKKLEEKQAEIDRLTSGVRQPEPAAPEGRPAGVA